MTATSLVFLLLAGGTWALIPPGQVGGDCLQGTEPCLQPNSECIEGTCLCANFYRFLNGSCTTEDQSASLGKPCRGGGDCRGSGEFCSSFSVCMCLSTHVDVGSQCRPAVYPGQFGCEDSRQCNKGFPGAECDVSRRCVCPHGMHAQQQTCVLPLASSNVILSDDRFSSIRRSPSNFFSRRRYQQSATIPGGITPDSICSTDADCAGYPLAYCDGVCRCVSGALNAGSTCISSGNALQPAGSCAAGQTYVTEAGACMTVQQPGEPCQYSQQCAAAEPGAFCLRLRCECVYGMKQSGSGCTFVDNQCTKRGFIWISELGECKEVLPPGGRGCSHNLQCTQAYPEATCFLQTCTCPINFPIPIDGTCGRNCSAGETYSGVTGQCLPTVKPGNQCLYSSQCHAINPGMICDRNRCRCPAGMVYSGTKCTQQCPVGFIVNSKGVCSPGCRINQVEYEGECLNQVAPSFTCVVNAQCMGGASCQSGMCECPKAMVPRGSICVYLESEPGAECGDGQQCTGGSVCTNGNCTCPTGRQIVNRICVTPLTVPPNSPCNPSATCGGGSTCIGGVCVCPSNQSPIDGKCQVPAAVPPGSPCPTGKERCTGQSTCVSGVCQCPFGTYPNQNECIPIQASQAGAPCDANTRCTGLAVCVNGICQCPSGLVASGGECRAAIQVAPGSSCAMGEVCVGGSSCVSNVCTCPEMTKASNGVCLPYAPAHPGMSCGNGEICAGGSNCQHGLCVCPLGSVSLHGTCQPTTGDLGQCDTKFNCPGGAYCDRTRNKCVCPTGTIFVSGLCVALGRFAEARPASTQLGCFYDADCDDGRVCVLNKCRCMFGELPDGTCKNLWTKKITSFSRHQTQKQESTSTLSPTTKPNVDIGGTCVRVGVACGGDSICVAGICVCPLGMTPWQNTCVEHRTAKPGESCSRGEECTGGSACDEHTRKCECMRSSQMIIGNSCQERLRSHPGYPCSNGEMCVGGSTCRDGRCACPDEKIEVNKQCVERSVVGAGDICGNGEVCGGNSECDYTQKKCLCKRGQQIINHQCVEVVVVPPGDNCMGALVRCGGGAYCVRGRCECPSNQVPLAGKCTVQKQVPPGKSCTSAEICMGRSVCRNGVCQCTSDMVIVGTTCEIRRKIRPTESCRLTDECLGGSKCNGHVCECPAGQVVRDSICQPRLTKRPGLRCNPEDICVGQSICVHGKCQCRPGEKAVNGVCIKMPQVIPGGACAANDECINGSSCRGGICMCPTGHTIVAHMCKPIIKALPGNTCANGETCEGGSFCHQPTKVCRCQPGYMVAHGRCLGIDKSLPTLVPVLSRPSTARPSSQASLCRSNADCLRGAICRGGVCTCPLHLVMKNGACVSAVVAEGKRRPGLLKEPCDSDSHCAVVNSYCTPIGVCGCQNGFRVFGSTQCIRIHSYVKPSSTTTTSTTTTTTTFIPPIIQLPTTTEPVTPSIELRVPGTSCDLRSLCTQGSICVDGLCRCPAGFNLIHNNCVRRAPNKIVAPLSSCSSGEVCGGGSECIYGLCFCTDDRTLFRGECLTLSEIDSIREKELESMTTRTSTRFQRILTTVPATTPSTTTTTTEKSTTTTTTTMKTTTTATTPKSTTTVTRKTSLFTKARPVVEVIPSGITTTPATTRKSVFWFKVSRPGFECDDSTFCTNCSVCIDGFCSCPDGLELVGERCLSPIDARSCLASNQCPSGAECVGGECRCSPGLALSRFGFCMPLTYVDPGMSCKEGETCRGGSECQDGICVCAQGLFVRDNKCLPPVSGATRRRRAIVGTDDNTFIKLVTQAEKLASNLKQSLSLGERCSSQSTCANGGKCSGGFCRCPEGEVQAGASCLPRSSIGAQIVQPGENCQSGVFCDGGASCVSFTCRCHSGYEPISGVCSPVLAKASDDCSSGQRCSAGSLCVQGKCICPKGFTNVEGSCVPIGNVAKSPGLNCQQNPLICTGGSYCLSGICTCPTGTENVGGVCTLSSAITSYSPPGGPCVVNQVQCTGNSVCANGFCVCPGGEQIRNGFCLAIDSQADPGEICQEGITVCTGNSLCTNGLCTCPTGQTSLNGQCVRVVTANPCNPPCGLNAQCLPTGCQCNQGYNYVNGQCLPQCTTGCLPNSSCQQGVCQCNSGYAYTNGQCQPSCTTTCTNGQCNNGVCQCNSGYVLYQGQCAPQCFTNAQCIPNSSCQQNICVCNTGYVYSNGQCTSQCYSNSQCSPNGLCQQNSCGYTYTNGQCTPQCYSNSQCMPNAYCQQNTCTCNTGYALTQGQCYPQCTANYQCTANSACQQGVCTCNSGYVYNAGQCVPQCYSNSQCIPNASCQQGSCTCNTGYVFSQGQCAPQCSTNNQCYPNSYCQQGVCTCNTGYVYSNGQCSPQCNSNLQCTPNANCQQGSCICNAGYTYSQGQCYPSCSTNAQCSPSASCQQGICACSTGYVYSNGQCSPPCSSNNQCYPNSYCQQGVCTCNTGYAYSNGQCSPQCSSNNQCYPNSYCQQGACTCNAGYTYSQGQCYPSCSNNNQCSPNSLCQQGLCTCSTGYGYSNGQCSPQCSSNSQCSPNSYCQQGVCTCNVGYTYSQGQCYPSCSSNNQCSPNASCQQGICACSTGYVYSNGQCSPPCSSTNQCYPNSYCQQGVCTCNAGYVYSNGQCSPQCNSNLQCAPNSNCQQGSCVCNVGYTYSQGQCYPSCSTNAQCPTFASCQQGACTCNPGYTYSQGQCYPSCSANNQCYPNSSCQQGVCNCNTGYVYSNGQCSPQCSDQCQPNASCQQGLCQCNPGYNPGLGGACQPSYSPSYPINPFFGLPGQPCDQRPGALLCRNRALCVNNQCVCPTNLILAGRECVEYAGDVYPGQSCNSATICRGGASCTQGTCMCNPGYYPSGPNCIPNFQFRFSFPTTPNPFELPPGSQCNQICQYQPCLQNCGGGSYCVGGTCTCPIGTYIFNSQCVPQSAEPLMTTTLGPAPVTSRPARPGDYCDVSYYCTGGSSCILGICTCDPDYIPSADRMSCILNNARITQRSYPGGKCVKDRDCQGNSFCSPLGVCSCLENEEVKRNSCMKRPNIELAYPGSPCPENKACYAGSTCQNDYCVCPASTVTNSTGACVPIISTDTEEALPGSRCRPFGAPCQGGSQCVDHYCICRGGSKNLGNARCTGGNRDRGGQNTSGGSSGQLPTPQALKEKKRCTSFRQCDEPRICSLSGFCECPFTMTETAEGTCIFKIGRPGSYCDDVNALCQSPSECVNHRCVCPSDHIQQSQTCRRILTNVSPGEACLPGDTCVKGASCIRGVCQCANGATADNTACRLINKRDLRLRPPEERLSPCPSDGSCRLPDCFCSQTGTTPPGGLQPKQVPQMVILTFDDPVTDRTINIYKSIFNGKFRNPNGCGIKGTFFISHQFNNYDQSQWLHSRGNEIALNSITHEKLNNVTKDRWRHEMVGLRESLKAFSYVDPSTVKGIRAPHLLIGGDNQFDMMAENGLLYDNSMTAQEGPVWPQTLDYHLAWDCGEQNCPMKPHKGLWSLPMQLISSNDGIWHSLVRTAVKPYDTRETTLHLLQRNFYRNYNGNRAPFILNADSDFLTYLPDNGVVHAVEDWLKEILNKTDVYVVTASQAIEWMKRPTTLNEVSKFKPWQCNFRQNDHILPCENPSICSYDSRGPTGMPHSFRVCGSCPPSYPWIENSLGLKNLRV